MVVRNVHTRECSVGVFRTYTYGLSFNKTLFFHETANGGVRDFDLTILCFHTIITRFVDLYQLINFPTASSRCDFVLLQCVKKYYRRRMYKMYY